MTAIPRAHDRFIWSPPGIGRIDIVVTRVAADGAWADLICSIPDGATWRKRQRLPLSASFTPVFTTSTGPACESCGQATGYGRAIRNEPGTPLRCGTCALGAPVRPRLVLVGA